MNPFILLILAFAALFVWTAGSFFFWKISQGRRAVRSQTPASPAIRLAEQWLADSQRKMEDLIARSEHPLSTAQQELLELRLEASRLPQGVKNLRQVREALYAPLSPLSLDKDLLGITSLYLSPPDFRAVDPHLVCFKTALGEMPCLEMKSGEGPLSETQMKALLGQVGQTLLKLGPDLVAGGFLYFGKEGDYQACLANPEWSEGLKGRRLMVVDFKGLTALLISLRLAGDADRVLETFEAGVQTTLGLEGQSEKMGKVLARLGANSLKTRAVLEGQAPEDLKAAL